MGTDRPLAGRRVVVTRASEQAGALRALLEAEGAEVVEVATIAAAPPPDGGAALRAALHGRAPEWLVLTSPNGVHTVAAALDGAPLPAPLAVVGPGTAAAAAAEGWTPALVPERFVAEGLLAAFPAPSGTGRVVVAQAEGARPVLVEGLRAAGWAVDAVVAYRTVPAPLAGEARAAAAAADAVTFASGSAVEAYVGAGVPVPAVVVCIGPVTSAAARAAGLTVSAEAATHDLPGLVAAAVAALAPGGR